MSSWNPAQLPPFPPVRRKVFISYFRADRAEVEAFVAYWGGAQNVFIPQIIGAYGEDLINSDDAEYVIGQIRTRYITDSTVTMVLIGPCTHSRRHVDWEIKASLRQGEVYTPNGLLGVILPNQGNAAWLPPRFEANWNRENRDCYARYYVAPTSSDQLRSWIEDAYFARTTRAHLIVNPADTMRYNGRCRVCAVTH
jgi:hypothetical protein